MIPTRELLYDMYIKNDMSERKIAEILNIGEGKVDYWVRKYGLNFKRSNPDKVFNLKNIDRHDPIFCYYAGLIATDGYLDYKNKRISLRVNNEGSYEVLNNLKAYFDYIRPVCVYAGKNNDLSIPNSCIFKELEIMGIFGDKNNRSFSMNWYSLSNEECRKMFLRGVLDGDGNIKRKCGEFRIAMKSKSFIENLLAIFNTCLSNKYLLKYGTNSSGNKYPLIELHVADSVAFYEFVYSGYERFRFTDKYNKFLNIRHKGKDIVWTNTMIKC